MPDAQLRSVHKGFTLLEILIVVVLLSILAAIVVPKFTNAGEEARRVAFVTNMRTFANAAKIYMLKTGQYLENSASGAVPAGFDSFVDVNAWTKPTPMGGAWDAEQDSFGMRSGFGVHFQDGDLPDDNSMREVDAMIDDGDLATGQFRKVSDDRYYFVLADDPQAALALAAAGGAGVDPAADADRDASAADDARRRGRPDWAGNGGKGNGPNGRAVGNKHN